jgi:hypothetical protein
MIYADLIRKAKIFLGNRRYAYRQTFKGPLAEVVLRDLAKFCRANQPTFHADPRAHALIEGRREVWLRLQNYLQLTPDQLWELYGKQPEGE